MVTRVSCYVLEVTSLKVWPANSCSLTCSQWNTPSAQFHSPQANATLRSTDQIFCTRSKMLHAQNMPQIWHCRAWFPVILLLSKENIAKKLLPLNGLMKLCYWSDLVMNSLHVTWHSILCLIINYDISLVLRANINTDDVLTLFYGELMYKMLSINMYIL